MDIVFHPGNPPWVDFYPYTPSLSAGYAFTALFGISTVAHIVLMFPYRAAYCIPIVIGGICEAFSYYGRAWSHQNPREIKSYMLQEILILCAPTFIAATVYMVLGRIVQSLKAEHLCSMRTKWITTVFVLNDVICFLTQIGGTGVQASGNATTMDIGRKVVLGGLIFSLIVFCFFVLIAVLFHVRLNREPTEVVLRQCPPLGPWKRYMWALYVACAALMFRNLIRTIQFGVGNQSPLNQKEAFIYVFDGAMMLAVFLVLAIYHPGRLIKSARHAPKINSFYIHDPAKSRSDPAQIPLTQYSDGWRN